MRSVVVESGASDYGETIAIGPHRLTADDAAAAGELSEEQRRRLLEISGHCPVHRMLTSGVDLRSSLEPA